MATQLEAYQLGNQKKRRSTNQAQLEAYQLGNQKKRRSTNQASREAGILAGHRIAYRRRIILRVCGLNLAEIALGSNRFIHVFAFASLTTSELNTISSPKKLTAIRAQPPGL